MAEVAEQYGPYTCVRRLGAGGMAETFLAVQHGSAGFEQRVCMKFMLGALRNDPTFRQMFLREATIAASLRHANIVGVIDVDEQAGYIVLELVDGVDLRRVLEAAPNRRLPAHLVSLIAVELCKALAYAHARTRRGAPNGVVHRDISPSNVLVSHHGEIKLTDFGVAKAMGSVTEPTSAGIKGKLCYMSPEQARGETLDGRSDLFSLGVMLFELLAGVRPFDGPSDAQTVLRIEAGKHASLVELAPDIPGGLALVVERMLRRDPDHRYPTADAVIDALARFAAPVTAYRELGHLARLARPPVTLSTADFVTPGSGSRPVPEQFAVRRTPDPAEARSPHARTLRLPQPEPAESNRPQLAPEPPSEEVPRRTIELVVAPEALQARPKKSVSNGAWFALGGALLAACVVLVTWIARVGSGDIPFLDPKARSDKPAEQPPGPTPGADAKTEPSPRAPPSEDDTKKLLRPNVPESDEAPTSPEPPPTTPPEPGPQPQRPNPRPEPHDAKTAPSGATSVLRVGTVPFGQVWIDGELAGWSPIVMNVSPGVHTVEGGNTQPEVKRSVKLRAGETKRVVLSMENDAMLDESADSPSRP
jgi:hypothetical protein